MLFFTSKNVIIRIKNRGGILDVIISFFRDFLSGPLYIVVVVFSVIGIVACIGYLAEATLKQKELEKRQKEMYAEVHFLPTDDVSAASIASNAVTTISSAQLQHVGNVVTTNVAQTENVVTNDMVAEVIGDSDSISNSTSAQPKQDEIISDEHQQ